MDESDEDDPCDDVSGKSSLDGWLNAAKKITTKKKKKIERDYPPYPGIEPEDNE